MILSRASLSYVLSFPKMFFQASQRTGPNFLGSVETRVSSSGWETTTATGGERPNFERVGRERL